MRNKTQVHNSFAAPNPRGERGGFRVISRRLMTLKPHSPLGRVGARGLKTIRQKVQKTPDIETRSQIVLSLAKVFGRGVE
jgi:hypothetical protein